MTALPTLPPLHEVSAHFDELARRAARPLETIQSPPPAGCERPAVSERYAVDYPAIVVHETERALLLWIGGTREQGEATWCPRRLFVRRTETGVRVARPIMWTPAKRIGRRVEPIGAWRS